MVAQVLSKRIKLPKIELSVSKTPSAVDRTSVAHDKRHAQFSYAACVQTDAEVAKSTGAVIAATAWCMSMPTLSGWGPTFSPTGSAQFGTGDSGSSAPPSISATSTSTTLSSPTCTATVTQTAIIILTR